MNVEKNMPLKVRIESQHYWTAGILYQGTLIYELCNITYILPFKKLKTLKTKNIFLKKFYGRHQRHSIRRFRWVVSDLQKMDSPTPLKLAPKLGQSRPI